MLDIPLIHAVGITHSIGENTVPTNTECILIQGCCDPYRHKAIYNDHKYGIAYKMDNLYIPTWYIYMCVCVRACEYINMHMCMCMYAYTHTHTHICMHICTYIGVFYICIWMCMCVYAHIHEYIWELLNC